MGHSSPFERARASARGRENIVLTGCLPQRKVLLRSCAYCDDVHFLTRLQEQQVCFRGDLSHKTSTSCYRLIFWKQHNRAVLGINPTWCSSDSGGFSFFSYGGYLHLESTGRGRVMETQWWDSHDLQSSLTHYFPLGTFALPCFLQPQQCWNRAMLNLHVILYHKRRGYSRYQYLSHDILSNA